MTALLVARPLFPSESAATHGDGLTVVMLWIALAVFWLLGAIGRPKLALRFGCDRRRRGAVDALAHRGRAVGRRARQPPAGRQHALGMDRHGAELLPGAAVDRHAARVRAVAAVMVALAVAVSAYGLYQWAYEMPQTRAVYQADPDRALRDAGLWFPPGSPERKLFEDRLASNLPAATFALTNSLAGFLAPWLVVLAGDCVEFRAKPQAAGGHDCLSDADCRVSRC